MGDVLTLEDILAAERELRAAERPTVEGCYVFPVHPAARGRLFALLLLGAWGENIAARWGAEERKLRGGG